jgi:hypothetical protein
MMPMHDDLFGDLSIEFLSYSGKCDVPFFGEMTEFGFSIRCMEDMEIQEAQREVFADFMKHKEHYAQQAETAIFHYYASECDDFRDAFDPETVDQHAPNITDVSQLKDLLSCGGVTILHPDIHGKSFGLVYECSWDEEDGVAVKFVDGQVVGTSKQWIVI